MGLGCVAIDPGNAPMAAAWNGEDGAHWLRWAEHYDRAVSWHHERLLAAAGIGATDRVLDILNQEAAGTTVPSAR